MILQELGNLEHSGREDWGTLGKIRGITTRDPKQNPIKIDLSNCSCFCFFKTLSCALKSNAGRCKVFLVNFACKIHPLYSYQLSKKTLKNRAQFFCTTKHGKPNHLKRPNSNIQVILCDRFIACWRSRFAFPKGHVNSPSQKGHKELPGLGIFTNSNSGNLPHMKLIMALEGFSESSADAKATTTSILGS